MTTNNNTHGGIDLINSLVQAALETHKYPLHQKLQQVSEDAAAKYQTTAAEIRSMTTIIENKGNEVGAMGARIELWRTATKDLGLPNPTVKGSLYIQRKDIKEVQQLFDDCEADLVAMKKNVVKAWPALVQEAKTRKAKLAQFIEWPSANEFVSKYSIGLRWMAQPMAIPEGVLSGLSAEVRAEAEAKSNAYVNANLRQAHYGPVKDLVGSITKLVEDWDKGKKRVRQEPYDALKEAAKKLDDLNWLRLPELAALSDVLDNAGNIDMVNTPKDERDKAFDKVRTAKQKMEDAIAKQNAALGI
jgi:hypothetical protein